MIDLLAIFIIFFSVIDPIGTIPVYIEATKGYAEKAKKKIAFRAVLIAAVVLVFFVIAGELLLKAIDIPLPAFEIAGGIVLFIFALSMIFGESKPEQEVKMISSESETAVFPLAIPSIASPGAILAAVLQTENVRFTIWEQVQVTGMILAVLLVVLILLLSSTYVHRIIGKSGASLVSRVMGLILSAVAVSSVLSGIMTYFRL